MKDPLSPHQQQDPKNTLIMMAVVAAATVGLMVFGPKPQPPAPQAAPTPDAGTSAPAQAGTQPPAPAQQAAAEPSAEPAAPERTVDGQRTLARYRFSSAGAGLVSAELLGPKMREQQHTTLAEGWKNLLTGRHPDAPQMNLAVPVAGQPLPFSVSIAGNQPLLASTAWRVVEEAEGRVVMAAKSGPWEVTKTLTWPREGFELTYALSVKNTSGAAQAGELQLHHVRGIDPEREHAPSFLGGVGNQSTPHCFVADKVHKVTPKDEGHTEDFKGPVGFLGIDQTYFVSSLWPVGGALEGSCTLSASPTQRSVRAAFPLQVGAGQTQTFTFGGYLGPKDTDLLAAVPTQLAAAGGAAAAAGTQYHPKLEDTVDFGIWAFLSKLLLWVLKACHRLSGNWGVAIILLTALVKLILLPLTHRSMVSMEQMKKLQPRMQEIQKKFADDKERQQLETMKLYQEAKVNPLGGCLPILIQMPVWFALYAALRNSFDIYWEPFFGPVWSDLTYKDPTYLIPALLGLSMIITQKLQPQMMDAAQARIMVWVMPIIFTLTVMNTPAGLTLYIFTNNALSILQQYGLRKWLERKGQLTPVAAPAGGKRK